MPKKDEALTSFHLNAEVTRLHEEFAFLLMQRFILKGSFHRIYDSLLLDPSLGLGVREVNLLLVGKGSHCPSAAFLLSSRSRYAAMLSLDELAPRSPLLHSMALENKAEKQIIDFL